MPDTTYIDAEAQRLKKQIDAAEELVASTTDPDEKLAVQTRLDKLNDDYRLILVAGANAARTPAAAASQEQTINGVVYTPDPANPNGPWIPRAGTTNVPNLDEQQLKAVENQMAGAKRDEIERNRAAGKGGLTDEQVNTYERLKAEGQVSAGTLTLARQKWESDNAIAQAKLPGELAQTTATTARIGAQTDLDRAQIAALALKTPADVAQAEASGALSKAQADRIRQQMGQPTIQDLGTQATYGVMTPGGTIEERYRQGYVPKTRAEIAARAGQIQTLMRQKAAELKGKIGANYSAEDANRDFNAWADQNVDPQQTALSAAAEEADFARANLEAEQRRQNMTGALAAGTQAREVFTAAAPYRVGENYGQGFEKMLNASLKGSGHGDINMTGSATWKGPDMMSQSPQQATMEALKYLSPTAAQASGMPQPNYQGVDLNQAFSRTPFQFGGGPPPAPQSGQVPQHPVYAGLAQGTGPVPGMGPQTGPFGTPQQQINRRLASFQTEAATNQQPNAFRGINPGGMAALMAQQAAAPAPAAPPTPEMGPPRPGTPMPYRRPAVGSPQPEPMPWGPQATQAVNAGGWTDPTPWATQASNAVNIGGWNTPIPDYPYGPPNLPSNTTYTPPPDLAPPGLPPGYMPGTSVGSPGLPGNVLPGWPSINPMGLWDQVTPTSQQNQSILDELQRRGVPASMLGTYRYGGGGGYGNSGFTP